MIQNAATTPLRDISRNGKGSHGPLPNIAHSPSVLSRLKQVLPHREDIVMADGRQIKGGIVLHPIVATAMLGVIIGAASLIYRTVSTELAWQHDQLITLSVQKVEADKRAAEKAEELSKRLQNIDAVQIVLGRDLAKLQESQKARRN